MLGYHFMEGYLLCFLFLMSFIYIAITGSVVGVAYYAAATAVANMVERTGTLSQALYPKLLADGSREYVTENFTLVMYFAIPLLVLAALFSRYGMFLLNPEYAEAWMAGVLLAFGSFLYVLIGFFQKVLRGTEDVDVDENPRASALLRSRLFLVGTVSNAHQALYLIVLTTVLYAFLGLPDLELVTVWSAVMLAVSLPFLIYYGAAVRKYSPFRVPYVAILKHLAGGAGIVATFLLTNEHVVMLETSIYSYLPGLLLEIGLCCAVYIGITYTIDPRTRKLFHMILSEIASVFKGARN